MTAATMLSKFAIQTLKGRPFSFCDLSRCVFDAEEVSTVLARVPRYAGHTTWAYSVGQHSVLVARRFDDLSMRLCGLLHDAAEAFVGDQTTVLKAWCSEHDDRSLPELEVRIWTWIASSHGLWPGLIDEVKREDRAAIATERRDLMSEATYHWECELPSPWDERIEPWSQEYTRDEWLREYSELCRRMSSSRVR